MGARHELVFLLFELQLGDVAEADAVEVKDIDKSGDCVVSSVWTNINGDWKQTLYHETTAEPQPKK